MAVTTSPIAFKPLPTQSKESKANVPPAHTLLRTQIDTDFDLIEAWATSQQPGITVTFVTGAALATAATGWSVYRANGWIVGDLRMMFLDFERTGAALTANSSGRIISAMGTVVDTRFRIGNSYWSTPAHATHGLACVEANSAGAISLMGLSFGGMNVNPGNHISTRAQVYIPKL